MLPSIGFMEMLLIAALLIIVVGPKDMPKMMQTIGRYIGQFKRMGQEFKEAFDEMGRQTELDDLRKEIEELKDMGKLTNLSEDAFNDDLNALDTELRETVAMPHPRTASTPTPADSAKGGTDGGT